jgi:hypothetical protein
MQNEKEMKRKEAIKRSETKQNERNATKGKKRTVATAK